MVIQNFENKLSPDQLQNYKRFINNAINIDVAALYDIIARYNVQFLSFYIQVSLVDNFYLKVPYNEFATKHFFVLFRHLENIIKNEAKVQLLFNVIGYADFYKTRDFECFKAVDKLPELLCKKLNEIIDWFKDNSAFRYCYGEGYEKYTEQGTFEYFFEYSCGTTIDFPFDLTNLDLLEKQILWFDVMHKKALEVTFLESLM